MPAATNEKTSAGRTEEAIRFARDEFRPVAEKLTERFYAKAMPLALEEGWQPEVADMIGSVGALSFLHDMLNGASPQEAFDVAMKVGRRRALCALFKNAVEKDGDHRAAFLNIIERIRECSVRSGNGTVDIPDAIMAVALRAIAAAAERGAPAEEQALAGLASITQSSRAAESATGGEI